MIGAPEFAFIATPAAQSRARRAAFALASLGYDARSYSAEHAAHARGAHALVLCGLTQAVPAARCVVDLLEAPHAPFAYADALTAASEHLAREAASALGRAVHYIPDPPEVPAAAPLALKSGINSRVVQWLARRARVASEAWRTRLLWASETDVGDAVLGACPALRRLGRTRPLELRCIAPPAVLEALADKLREDEPDALRLSFAAWSPAAIAEALAACHFVILPPGPAAVVDAVNAGRLAIAQPDPRFGALSEFAWVGEDPARGIEWALAHAREVMERIARGQTLLAERHAPGSVARRWLEVLDPKK